MGISAYRLRSDQGGAAMGAGRTPSGVFGILVFGSVGLLSILLAAPGDPGPQATRVSQLASIPLTDDDGDQALFATTALGPGGR